MASKRIKKILGLNKHDKLIGTRASEALYGAGGDDTLTGGGGNDSLSGGKGVDTAVFSGRFADYDFSNPAGGGLIVSHVRGNRADGRDTIAADVEFLQFADVKIDLRTNRNPVARNDVNGGDAVIERGLGVAGDAKAAGDVLTNDRDIEVLLGRQTLRVVNAGTYTGIYGTLVLNADGTWTYTLSDDDPDTNALGLKGSHTLTPHSQIVTESFSYVVTDGKGGLATGTLNIAIRGSNDAPIVTGAVTAPVGEDGASATIHLLANASDPDRTDTIAISNFSHAVTSGTWAPAIAYSINPSTNVLTINPAQFNVLGTSETIEITFSYNVIDRKGGVTPATAVVTVTGANDAPVVIGAVTRTIDEDDAGPATVSLLANASDPDRTDDIDVASVTYAVTGGSWTSGVVYSLDPETGALMLDPAQFNALGATETIELTFSYTVVDEHGGLTPATAVVTITGTNDAPVAVDDDLTVTGPYAAEGAALVIDRSILLANDSDADRGTTLAAYDHDMTSALGAAVTSPGTTVFTYDPTGVAAIEALAAGESITDTFGYSAWDGLTPSGFAQVSVKVLGSNDGVLITSGAQAGLVQEDLPASTANGTVAFTDIDLSDSHLATFAASPSNTTVLGSFALSPVSEAANAAAGSVGWTYTIDGAATQHLTQDQEVTETYLVTIDDGQGSTAVQAVVITIKGTNDAPVVTGAVTRTIDEDDVAPALVDLLANASDPDDTDDVDVASVSYAVTGGSWTPAVVYSVDAETGVLSLDPAQFNTLGQNETVEITFSYDIVDGRGGVTAATAIVTITGANDAPVIRSVALPSPTAEQVNTQSVGEQDITFASTLPDGRFLVTWTDRYEGERKAQLLDPTGAKIGGELSLMAATTGYDSAQIMLASGDVVVLSGTGPEFGKIVAADGSTIVGTVPHMTGISGYMFTTPLTGGGFAVAASTGGYTQISVQAYNANGAKVGPQWTIPSGTFNEFVVKEVVGLADGGYVLLYDLVGGGLKAQRFDASGTAMGATYDVGSRTSDITIYGNLDAIRLSDDRLFVTWSQADAGGGQEVYGKFLDASGTPIGSAFVVAPGTSGDSFTKVTETADGRLAVTWYSGGAHHIQLLDASGAFLGPAQILSNSVGTVHFSIAGALFPAPTPDGGIFFVWRGLDGSGEGALGRYLGPDGQFTGPAINLSPTTAGTQVSEHVAANALGVVVALYVDVNGADGSSIGVFMRRFDTSSGSVVAIGSESSGSLSVDLLAFASDPDRTDDIDVASVTYAVTGGTWAPAVAYSLDAETGVLSLDPAQFNALGSNETVTLTFNYSVVDGEGGVTPTTAVVTIRGTNDAPTLAAVTIATVADTAAQDDFGTVSGSLGLAAADSDRGAVLTYALAPGEDGSSSYGTLTLNANGDYEYAPNDAAIDALNEGATFNDIFIVQVTDEHGASAMSTLSVPIDPANDAPEFTDADDAYAFSVNENLPAGTFVGQTLATDADDATLAYAITGGTGLGHFAIDADGNISTTESFDYELGSAYTLSIQAEDAGGLVDTAEVVVTIGDVSEVELLASYSQSSALADLPGNDLQVTRITFSGSDVWSGTYATGGGDNNGDGLSDYVIGMPGPAGSTGYGPGRAFVGYGSTSPASGSIDGPPALANGTQGFLFQGPPGGTNFGFSASNSGDFNADGFDDLLVGSYTTGASLHLGSAGQPPISSYSPTLDTHFQGGGRLGWSVDFAGDFNGDGFDDIIIGAPDASTAYLIYGAADTPEGNFNINFASVRFTGATETGSSVSAAGDLNNDGFDDIIIGAESASKAYVVFGRTGLVGGIGLDGYLNGTTGFSFSGGSRTGWSVGDAGDVNGDGVDDVAIGAFYADPFGRSDAGETYVLYGHVGPFVSVLTNAGLDGLTGLTITGAQSSDHAGAAVSTAGDMNGDGYDDLVIGAFGANSFRGEANIVFGGGALGAVVDLATLNGHNGFQITGDPGTSEFGFTVGSAGDLNGDGFDDVILGSAFENGNRGNTYIVYGGDYIV